MNVLRRHLKVCKDWQLRISWGKEFHRVGAETEKAWSPYNVLVLGVTRRCLSDDLRWRWGEYWVRRSCRYVGALSLRAFHVISIILKATLCLTGSQWRFLRTGVMCSNFRVRDKTRAAVFCTRWSLHMRVLVIPNKSELPLSNLDVTRACIRMAADSSVRIRRMLLMFLMW